MAQNITLMNASYPSVPSVLLPKTGGGTASFTDVTDTTATASDVAAGKYFYTAAGVRTEGTGTSGGGSVTQDANGYIVLPSTGGGGGGSSVQTSTGTFTGSGTTSATISCSFAPDLIWVYGDLSGDPSLRGVITFVIIKDTAIFVTVDGSTSSYSPTLYEDASGITGYGDSATPHATYSSNTLTLDMVTSSSSTRFNSSATYQYKFVKWS